MKVVKRETNKRKRSSGDVMMVTLEHYHPMSRDMSFFFLVLVLVLVLLPSVPNETPAKYDPIPVDQ